MAKGRKERKTAPVKVEVTLLELREAVQGLTQLLAMELPAKHAFVLGREAREINNILLDFNDQQARLMDGQEEVPEESREELDGLLRTTVELSVKPLPLEAFDGKEVAPAIFMVCHFLFDGDE